MPPMDTDDDRHYWRYTLNRQCPTGRVLIFGLAEQTAIENMGPFGTFFGSALIGRLDLS